MKNEKRYIYVESLSTSHGLDRVLIGHDNFKDILRIHGIKISKGVYLEDGVILYNNVTIGDKVSRYARYSGYIDGSNKCTFFEMCTIDIVDKKEGYNLVIGRDTVVHSGVNIFT